MDYLDFLAIPSEVRVQPESPLSRMYTSFPTVRKFVVWASAISRAYAATL